MLLEHKYPIKPLLSVEIFHRCLLPAFFYQHQHVRLSILRSLLMRKQISHLKRKLSSCSRLSNILFEVNFGNSFCLLVRKAMFR